MAKLLTLEKYSLGVGDRFGRQAAAQLRACIEAGRNGLLVVPVWNKSNREHVLIGSEPVDTRWAADTAVKRLRWDKPYHVDADHIGSKTVGRFLPYADYYTIDVADFIGSPIELERLDVFLDRHPEWAGRLEIPGVAHPFDFERSRLVAIAQKYLPATQEAGRIYRQIAAAKGQAAFVTEVSMDETLDAQGPGELLLILAALADEGVTAQTIAPKFTGRFNKGVDYVGNLAQFEREFSDDVAVVRFAATRYPLPKSLKLSVHSGSDKFSLYPVMHSVLKRFDAGLHLKTAGTTWLEELIGLAQAGGGGLSLAKEIYGEALGRLDELCAPYASVIDIDRAGLPTASTVMGWAAEQFASALRHDKTASTFNPHLRQLLHVSYKIAAEKGNRYLDALQANEDVIAKNVMTNLFDRHLEPLFL
ncbi:MAG TPA: tagaturonate epimerase family protein [Verrucomicrobiae bacterium]|nr:tagaturonate epimerase family protein [Verrucomicrobiae bacterium]